MKKISSVIFILAPILSLKHVYAEDWLTDKTSPKEIYAVIPERVDEDTIKGFKIEQVQLYKDGKLVDGYGFEIKEDGHTFDFDESSVDRFYLRPSSHYFTWGERFTSWKCSSGYFNAVVHGQHERVDKDYKSLKSYYPKGTSYTVKYTDVTEVLGRKKIKEQMQPIEVWGLANSQKNAEIMVNYLESRIIDANYHFFAIPGVEFEKASEINDDRVSVNFKLNIRITETYRDGNIIHGLDLSKGIIT